jgi:putative thiamine transport system permease protein
MAGRPAIESGRRRTFEKALLALTAIAGCFLLALVGLSFVSVALWSVAEVWRFPNPLPATFTLANWQSESARAMALICNSFLIAGVSVLIATVLSVGCLENEVRRGRSASGRALWLLYTPLLVPQIAYLLGLQILLVGLGLDETLLAVVLVHLVFVLPYVFLALADPWRAFDDRYRQVGLSLGASANRVLLAVRLPLLLRAVLAAAAVGIAVSIGQYLPTLLVAGARWPTITTEAVTVASGGNRRVAAIYALLQSVLPFVAFFVAIAVPGYVFRNRRGLRAP